ncbi:MAG: phospholipase D-like domain-containing protein [Marmoricola sp.]
MKRLGWLLAAALVFSVPAVLQSPAQAEPPPQLAHPSTATRSWMPDPGAHFNIPRTRVAQWNLEKRVVAAINHAHRGSYIKFSIYSFDRKPVARALIRAHHRGVTVRVLLNDHRFSGAQRLLRNALTANRSHRSWSYMCTHGCRSSGDILHSKFYLFSHTGGAHYVSMVGSVNMTYNSVHNQFNDLWISNSHKSTFMWFNDLFNQEAQDQPSWRQNPPHRANESWPHPGQSEGTESTEAQIRARLTASPAHSSVLLQAIPWPRPSSRNDPIMAILRRVHCYGATGGTGGSGNRTIVRVNMHAWTQDRGAWIAKRLRYMYAHGCHVQLLYGFGGAKVRHVLAQRTSRGYVPTRSDGYDTNGDHELDKYSHQKELLISGHYGSQSGYRLSITGSSNYADHGLTGDEILFLIHRHAAYNAYVRNFNTIWDHYSHPTRYQPRRSTSMSLADRMADDNLGGLAKTPSDLLNGPGDTLLVPQPRPAGPAWEGD